MRISDWSSDVCSSDLVHNKLQAATALLPQEVQRQGVTVAKSAASFLLITAIYSEDGTHTANDLSDYIVSQIQDPVSRINGVGELQIFGTQRSEEHTSELQSLMRISYAVFCLKKKKKNNNHIAHNTKK